MADAITQPAGSEPPPVTYKNPRRTSPENSITLRHHRIAREASKRNSLKPNPKISAVGPARRTSTDESNETGISDPERWFDRSNQNPNAVDSSMDVDPPFFQKVTDSSEEDPMVPSQSPAYNFVQSHNQSLLRPGLTHHSSSADDYRSVIDDLTVENKRLREELKRYRQMGPDSLRRDKLFEVKVHGLPSRKKRELEAALRDFTTSLDGSSNGQSPSSRRKDKGKGMSKHASSSSGSNSRPNRTDSAYASMSTGNTSSGPSLTTRFSKQKNDQAVERYLRDVPEGLWPRPAALTEKEKMKLVVRRLEQLFTGQGLGHTKQPLLPLVPPAISEDVEMSGTSDDKLPQPSPAEAASREAQILPRSGRKESHSRGHEESVSNSNEDQTECPDMGNGSGLKENDASPTDVKLPEQRPTRPRDLDPDRVQVPSENMDYIRHLGLHAPQSRRRYSAKDVSPDAEGWVYLNLLCNLAQLHMLNVTPAFIRSAVSEKSTQFQLSPDGRKIRWRGGDEGTKFSSDSSGSTSQRGNSSPDTDGSNVQDQRKKQKTQTQTPGNDIIVSEPPKFGPQQMSSSSDSFHYKPLFHHHQTSSSDEQPSCGDETGSSLGALEESNLGMNSRWGHSGVSGVSQRKRRRDGAIIYYTGAPFCTDLSGDFGEVSTDSYNMTSHDPTPAMQGQGPTFNRTHSGSSIPFRPLSHYVSHRAMMDLDFAPPETPSAESDVSDDMEANFPWSNSKQSAKLTKLEASGLGGVTPDDHFVVVVSTRRPKESNLRRPSLIERQSSETAASRDTTESIVGRLAILSTGSPQPPQAPFRHTKPHVDIKYVTGKVKRLPPSPLPPPAFYFGTSEDDVSSDDDSAYESSGECFEDDGVISRRLIFRAGETYSPNEELSSNDEEDEHSDDAAEFDDRHSTSPEKMEIADNVGELGMGRHRSARVSDLSKMTTGSSVATAGGAVSGYSSAAEI